MKSYSNSEHLKDLLFYKEIPADEKASCRFGGRTEELVKMASLISKRQNRSILIWGDFGIGKSSLIYQLIWAFSSDNFPDGFGDYLFLELNVPALISKSKEDIHNSFNELRSILEKNSNIILIVENLETVTENNSNVEIELKYLLQMPEVCIIATADVNNNETIAKHSVYNRFEKIKLTEPTAFDVYEMIKYQIPDMEKFHHVKISKKTVKWLIYSSIIFSNTNNPKRVVDLLDTVMTHANLIGHKTVTKNDYFDFFNLEFEQYHNLSDIEKKNTAIHELGHFFVNYYSETLLCLKPYLVTIVPTDIFLGSTYLAELKNKLSVSNKNYYIQNIASDLAGKIAEEIFGVPVNAGSSMDLEHANTLAEEYSTQSGMNMLLKDRVIFNRDTSIDDTTRENIDESIKSIMEQARDYAEEIIRKNKGIINAIIPYFIKNNGILTRMEIEEIMRTQKLS